MTTPTTFLDFLRKFSHATGVEVSAAINTKDAATRTYIDQQIATLTGDNSAVVAFLQQIKLLVDANEGTPEFEAGQNLYTLVANRYSTLQSALTETNTSVAGLVTQLASAITDLSALTARVATLEGLSAVLRTDVNAVKAAVDTFLGDVGSMFADITVQMSHLRAGLRGEVAPGN